MSHPGQVHHTLALSPTVVTLFLGGFVPSDTYSYCLSQLHLPVHITTSFFFVSHHQPPAPHDAPPGLEVQGLPSPLNSALSN